MPQKETNHTSGFIVQETGSKRDDITGIVQSQRLNFVSNPILPYFVILSGTILMNPAGFLYAHLPLVLTTESLEVLAISNIFPGAISQNPLLIFLGGPQKSELSSGDSSRGIPQTRAL